MGDSSVRRPRWRTLVPFAVFLALCALLAPAFQRPPPKDVPPAIRARFDQIRDGMTEGEVEGLLGGPRGVYDPARFDTTMTTASGVGGPGSSHLSWWYFPDCDVEVGFDRDGRVCWKEIGPPQPQSPFQRAVRWCERALLAPGP